MELVSIPAGWFSMGSPESKHGQDDERPCRRVWIDGFEIARFQTTNRNYAKFLEETGETAPPFWNQPEFKNPEQPVAGVTWDAAARYCQWLGAACRLPSEAEWERAARGFQEGCDFPWGDAAPESRPAYASRWQRGPEQVGTSPPNDFGLFDMCENVHEWCLDFYDAGFYAVAPESNPRCTEARPRRSSKGGSWRHHIKIARCAARSSIPPHFAYADYGFRVARGDAQV